jgi:hypothetical protein
MILDARIHGVLLRIDQELAAHTQAQGCQHCGGKLHSAQYPRKPRGWPSGEASVATRLSFCCETCRRRTTPASVRYLGRRVYSAAAMLLWSAAWGRRRHDVHSMLRQALVVPQRTLERWQSWWRMAFPKTPFWGAARAHFMPVIDDRSLPGTLMERLDNGNPVIQLLRTLCFLATGP